jgi:uncharacterized phage protein (predicted DNA packaging)
MPELEELKEWLKIDGNAEDATLTSLLLSSKFIIRHATGVNIEDVQDDPEAHEMYILIKRLLITDLYENRASSMSPIVVSLCSQLKLYKLQGGA